jgi:CarD family transcriptional regulator
LEKNAMAARKKIAKRTAGRGSKAQKRTTKTAAKSAKNSAARKSKASKTLTKLEKATLAARQKAAKAKAAAKSAKHPTAPAKTKAAAKRVSAASKTARPSVKHKVEHAAKGAGGAQTVKTIAATSHAKENQELSAAKIKTEVKTPASIKTSPAAKTGVSPPKGAVGAVAAVTKPAAVEAARAPSPAAQPPAKTAPAVAPVVPLQGAAKPPARPAGSDGAPAPRVEEPAAPKGAKHAAPRHGFKAHEFVVYPAHGVGQIVAVEEQEVAGFRLELFVITFVKDKMMLRVPVGKAASVGMRKLSDPDLVKRALDTLLGRARIKRTMWSRRAQEYEAKINSGDLIAIAEVVRDLYRSEAQPEQSYSERQLYEAALDRMAREVAVVQKLGETDALKAIEGQLQKGQRRGKTDAAPGEPGGDADVEEAA